VNEFHVHEMYFNEFHAFLHKEFKNVAILNQRTECVQIINNKETKHLEIVLSEQHDYANSQNMIAICSDLSLAPHDFGSVVLDIDHAHMSFESQRAAFAQTQAELAQTQAELAQTQAELADGRRILSHPVIRVQRAIWKRLKFWK